MDVLVQKSKNWPFYFSLEQDVLKLSRYIEFDRSNFQVHSIELLRLYLSICSEVDVVLKQVCQRLTGKTDARNIIDYQKLIAPELPQLFEERAVCARFNIVLEPWKGWTADKSPDWWRSYNDVKHNRSEHYNKAKLGNVLESLAALYLVNMYNVFFEHKQLCPGFYFNVRDVVHHAPIEGDFYRIDDFMAYVSE